MGDNVRVYYPRFSYMIRRSLFGLGIFVVLLLIAGIDRRGRGIESVRSTQIFYFISIGIALIYLWFQYVKREPRLEVNDYGVRFVGGGGLFLRTAWCDVERIDSWNYDGFTTCQGLVSRKLDFHRSWWMNFMVEENGDFKPFFAKYALAKMNNGIPLQPMFARNIEEGELADELRRYVPQIFTQ